MKAIATLFGDDVTNVPSVLGIGCFFLDNSGVPTNDQPFLDISGITGSETSTDLVAKATAAIVAYSTTQSYGITTADVLWPFAPAAAAKVVTPITLAVNTARQVSSDTTVRASVDITTTLSLTGGTAGKVALQYADNSTFTTNLVTVQQYTNSNTGTLTIGLNTSQIGTAALSGFVPSGKYYRLQTTNVTGTPTYGTPLVMELT